MPTYDVYVSTQSRRLKYPCGLNVPSVEAAHSIALTMARVFIGRRSASGHLSVAERDFHVEVVNEDGRTVLAVPGRWMGLLPQRVR
jgi:hypothetical protein